MPKTSPISFTKCPLMEKRSKICSSATMLLNLSDLAEVTGATFTLAALKQLAFAKQR